MFQLLDCVRHNKTGDLYTIIATPAYAFIEKGKVPAYIYAREGVIWIRPQTEMEDGRFTLIKYDWE